MTPPLRAAPRPNKGGVIDLWIWTSKFFACGGQFCLTNPYKGPQNTKIFAPAASNFALQIPMKGSQNNKIFAPAASIERGRRFFVFVFCKYDFTFKNTLLGPAAGGKFCDFLACLVDFLRF